MTRVVGWHAVLAGVAGACFLSAPAALSAVPQVRPRFPIPYFIADGAGKRGFRASDPELARWALEAWQRSADGLRFRSSREDDALIRLYWAEPEDGRYGETRPLVVGDRRGAAVYVRPDTDSLGPGIASGAARDGLLRETIVYLTCLHELGHALGLTHTSDFDDIMYSFGYGGNLAQYFGRYRAQIRSRSDIANVSGLSSADVDQLRAILVAR
jgi:hypothetical protein